MPKISVLKGERLIRSVRAHAALYDPAESDYSDIGAKAKLWSEVALQCGISSGMEAKMMWKNLRDCYRICRNKMCTNPKTKMWQFYDNMKFLEPYIKNRKSIGCPTDLRRTHPLMKNRESIKHAQSPQPVISVPREDFPDTVETHGEFATIQFWNDSEETDTGTTVVVPQIEKSFADRCASTLESSDEESYEDILPEQLNNVSAENSLKMFFDAMYASTSQLPSSLQRTIKNQIFTAVLQAEDEAEILKKVQLNENVKVEP